MVHNSDFLAGLSHYVKRIKFTMEGIRYEIRLLLSRQTHSVASIIDLSKPVLVALIVKLARVCIYGLSGVDSRLDSESHVIWNGTITAANTSNLNRTCRPNIIILGFHIIFQDFIIDYLKVPLSEKIILMLKEI